MDANSMTTAVRNVMLRLVGPFQNVFKGGYFDVMEKDKIGQRKSIVEHSLEAARNQCCGNEVEISLFKTSNYPLFKDEIPEPVRGTCEWFFNDERYLEWLNDSHEGLLWLTADPKCGKSVLSKALFNNTTAIGSSTTLCFFFSKSNEQQQSATAALCALLHQLFSQEEHLFFTHGTRAHSMHGDSLTSDLDALWQLLFQTTRVSRLDKVICILDGLDECRKDERHRLIQKLKDFNKDCSQGSPSTQSTSVKFLVTSRPYLDIESAFNNNDNMHDIPPVVRLAAEDQLDSISSDVKIVTRARIEELTTSRKLGPEVEESARSLFLGNEDATYLWQKHALQAVSDRNPGSSEEWEHLFTQLPPPVEDIYESILSQSPDQERATTILKIIVASTRPLTLSELDTALAIERSPTAYGDIQLCGDEYIAIHIRYICGLFLRIVNSKIYLIHSTARAFLLKQGGRASHSWMDCMGHAECHLALATICVRYLLREELRTDLADGDTDDADDNFRAYSISNWSDHFRESGADRDHPLTSLVFKLYSQTRCWRLSGMDRIIAPRPLFTSKVAALCFFGHIQRLECSQVKMQSTDILSNGFRCATKGGHLQAVHHLLDACAQNNTDIGSGLGTLLRMAVGSGHEEEVRKLLACGADANSSVGDWGCTAIHIAAQRGEANIVKILLAAGASVDTLHYGGGTALHEAAQRVFEKVTEVLIQAGANIGVYQPGRGTALHVAARHGNLRIVNILLDAGIDANINMPIDGIALYVAAAAGHEKLIDVLGAVSEVDVGSYGYCKALTLASMHENEKMVDLLHHLAWDSKNPFRSIKYRQIESGDTIHFEYRGPKDAIDIFKAAYRTALKSASARGNIKMVVFLLDTAEGAPTENLGINPALRAAAAGGHLAVVEEFIWTSKISVNVWGKQYGCALHAAAWGGHLKVAERLVRAGADLFAQNEDHGTPLHVAAMRGHKDVAEWLVQQDIATVNVAWQDHGTPLHVAAEQGGLSIVEVLLEQGADVNIKGPRSETPLQAARKAGHSKIVQLLVDAEQEQANAEQKFSERDPRAREQKEGATERGAEGN